MEKELLKQRLSVIADIAAIIIALTGTIYLLITLDPKYKLYLVCLLIQILFILYLVDYLFSVN